MNSLPPAPRRPHALEAAQTIMTTSPAPPFELYLSQDERLPHLILTNGTIFLRLELATGHVGADKPNEIAATLLMGDYTLLLTEPNLRLAGRKTKEIAKFLGAVSDAKTSSQRHEATASLQEAAKNLWKPGGGRLKGIAHAKLVEAIAQAFPSARAD